MVNIKMSKYRKGKNMSKQGFKKFELSEDIAKVLEFLNFKEPTKVQEKAIPYVLEGRDVIVKSQTGSGKTAAYGIPICEKIDWLENKPKALVLTPTRELAIQVKEDISNIGKLKRIKVTALFGRVPIGNQKTELKQKLHVVVGTPGRIFDHIEKGNFDYSKIEYLVIDEADEMLRMGFLDQVQVIIDRLPKERVTMLFSATMPGAVEKLAQKFMKNPEFVDVNDALVANHKIDQSYYQVEEEGKLGLLKDITIIENPDSAIIFANTKDQVESVYKALKMEGYLVDRIHGGMEQVDRMKGMDRFKRGEVRYLVATDVAARGIDVENISIVINYDIPLSKESYVHRIGRTGRAGLLGRSMTFVSKKEERSFREIETFVETEVTLLKQPLAEEVKEKEEAFIRRQEEKPEKKKSKSENLDKNITKLRFNAGKKKKLRATNFVWNITQIDGITAEDIGTITIMDTLSYVEILNGKGKKVIEAINHPNFQGKLPKLLNGRRGR